MFNMLKGHLTVKKQVDEFVGSLPQKMKNHQFSLKLTETDKSNK